MWKLASCHGWLISQKRVTYLQSTDVPWPFDYWRVNGNLEDSLMARSLKRRPKGSVSKRLSGSQASCDCFIGIKVHICLATRLYKYSMSWDDRSVKIYDDSTRIGLPVWRVCWKHHILWHHLQPTLRLSFYNKNWQLPTLRERPRCRSEIQVWQIPATEIPGWSAGGSISWWWSNAVWKFDEVCSFGKM